MKNFRNRLAPPSSENRFSPAGLISALAAGLLFAALPGAAPARAGLICVNDQVPDAFICPLPDGELVINSDGEEVCGFGWCAVDAAGRVRCSKVPGGAAVVDQYGNALCVGGCMEARADLCRRMKLPRFP